MKSLRLRSQTELVFCNGYPQEAKGEDPTGIQVWDLVVILSLLGDQHEGILSRSFIVDAMAPMA